MHRRDDDDRPAAPFVELAQEAPVGPRDLADQGRDPKPEEFHRPARAPAEGEAECRFREQCFAAKAKVRAEQAMVVVANYHLLFLHLHLREITGRDLILPSFDIAICDEGHKMADIAREFFGFRATAGSVRWAARPKACAG